MENKELETLKRKVYITSKARISVAERLKHTENFIQGLNIYYSLFLTALSIYSVNNSTSRLSLILTIASVVVTVSIIFLSTKRYAERAKDLKDNYIQLDQLYRNLCTTKEPEQLRELDSLYTQLLNTSENHSEYDYFTAIKNIKDENDTLTKKQKISFWVQRISRYLAIAILILLPFLMRYFATVIEWIVNM